jgi:antitoxin HicB
MGSTDTRHPHYSIVIQWSHEDRAYIVSIPEFPGTFTHGETHEEAVKQGRNLIESLIMWAEQDGKPLPEPQIFARR